MSNKIKQGVDFVFQQNPELKNIGTEEQYSQYLETIFPNSKVNDIVYHDTNERFEEFDKNKIGTGVDKIIKTKIGNPFEAFYFAPNLNWHKENPYNLSILLSALLDVRRPFQEHQSTVEKNLKYSGNPKYGYVDPIKKKSDGAIFYMDEGKPIQILAFEPSQIHILGSKKDIEGFKKYVKGKNELNNEKLVNGFNLNDLNLKINLLPKSTTFTFEKDRAQVKVKYGNKEVPIDIFMRYLENGEVYVGSLERTEDSFKGITIPTYIKLGKELSNQGLKFRSSPEEVTKYGKKVWDGLVELGYAQKKGKNYYFLNKNFKDKISSNSLESKLISGIFGISFLAGLFFISSSITGNATSNFTRNIFNPLGILLFVGSVVGLLIHLKSSKS